jgi:hypothetical protein
MTNATNAQERLRRWIAGGCYCQPKNLKKNQTQSFAVTGNAPNSSRGVEKYVLVVKAENQVSPPPTRSYTPLTKGVIVCYPLLLKEIIY